MKQRSHQNALRTTSNGFTLVELLIVVSIIGVLAAIAVPIYMQYVESGKLKAINANLQQFPVLLESYRAENGIMCPGCAANGTYLYGYSESSTGAPNYAGNKIIIDRTNLPGGANDFPLLDFRPKSPTDTNPIAHTYTLSINVAGCPANCVEIATFTATPVTGRGAPNRTLSGTFQ